MKIAITIPSPCSQSWNAMTVNNQGRHCGECSKTVVDFTTWGIEDVAAYLVRYAAEKPCGRFLPHQLNTAVEIEEILPKIVHWNTSILRKVAALIVVCFALVGASCGTNNRQQGEKTTQNSGNDTTSIIQLPTLGEPVSNTSDTLTEMGEVEPIQQTKKTTSKKKDDLSVLLGESGATRPPKEPTNSGLPADNSAIMGAPLMQKEIQPVDTAKK